MASLHTYIFTASDSDNVRLNMQDVLATLLTEICELGHMKIVERSFHAFEPSGFSACFILAESHIAMHTWPEEASGYITLSTCKQPDADFVPNAIETIISHLSGTVTVKEVHNGTI